MEHVVDFHVEAAQELAGLAPREQVSFLHARDKLVALGDQLPFPHQSAVAGSSGLRELRPRAGRSPWRGIYARSGERFVILAVAPEAQKDQRGFDKAVDDAARWLEGLGRNRNEQGRDD